MHAGFALLETGVCRSLSCQSILLKNILNVCFGTMVWFIFGYAFMYGDDALPAPLEDAIIGGGSYYFGSDRSGSIQECVPQATHSGETFGMIINVNGFFAISNSCSPLLNL